MITAPNRIYDGIVSFAGGQDDGRDGILLDEDQCQAIENAVCRGGNCATRPSLRNVTLNFTNNITYDDSGGHGGNNPVGSQDAFTNGLFQSAIYYEPSLLSDMIVVMIGGRIFTIIPNDIDADVTELYLDKQNRGNIPIGYMVQADRFLIIQDGESAPIIFDGITARRAGMDEIFTGTIMTYGLGRIVLIGKNKRDIYFGDLYGSHEGEPGASVLKFTETTFLSEGGAASVPFNLGHIVGAIFLPVQDTTMGQGQLLVFAEKGMASFFLDLPRDQWKTSKFQAIALIDIGATGHRTLVPVNSDIWFRATDGWRTYRQARSEAKGWFQLVLSNEVHSYVDVETQNLLYLSSAIHFQNRMITTCTPIPNQGRPYHNGFLSIDFNVLSSFSEEIHKPSWDGHWSGIKATRMVEGIFQGNRRAFVLGMDDNDNNILYEIRDDFTEDSSGPIVASVVPNSFDFKEYFNEGKLLDGDIWWEQVKDHTTIEVFFKPDRYPEYLPWRTADHYPLDPLDPIGVAGRISGGSPSLRKGFKPRRSLGKPNVPTDPTTKRDLRRGYNFDVKVEWTGNAQINRIRVHNDRETEKAKAEF